MVVWARVARIHGRARDFLSDGSQANVLRRKQGRRDVRAPRPAGRHRLLPGIRKRLIQPFGALVALAILHDVPYSRRVRSMEGLDHTLCERKLKNDFATRDSSGVPEAETEIELLRAAGARNIRGSKN